MKRISFVFFGTSEFGAIILEATAKAGCAPLAVMTKPDKPVGRGKNLTPSPVKIVAERFGIPLLQPETPIQAFPQLKSINPEIIVLAAYGSLIPQEILDIPKKGALNVHPSLLPRLRGPSPIQTAILEGATQTGVSLIVMDDEIDHGPIITQESFVIQNPRITFPELQNVLASVGANVLLSTLSLWNANSIIAKPQDHSQATFTKHFTKEDGHIDWTQPAGYIERQVRAFQPWPGTYCFFNKGGRKILCKVIDVCLADAGDKHSPGVLFQSVKGELCVQASDGALILNTLQMEGKKPISAKEALQGYPDLLSTILS